MRHVIIAALLASLAGPALSAECMPGETQVRILGTRPGGATKVHCPEGTEGWCRWTNQTQRGGAALRPGIMCLSADDLAASRWP